MERNSTKILVVRTERDGSEILVSGIERTSTDIPVTGTERNGTERNRMYWWNPIYGITYKIPFRSADT